VKSHGLLQRVLLSCFLTLGLLRGTRLAALPDVDSVARAVDEHYNHLRSMQADFTETYQGSGIERTESGTLWLKKPGKMRWEYRSPEVKLFIADGKEAWLYLPAEKQVRKSAVADLQDLRSPLAFLLGKAKLAKELSGLTFAPNVQVWKAGNAMLQGVPRGMEDRVRQVLLEITPDHQIARILVDGIDDSITEYRLMGEREDVNPPDSQFRFVPPPGTEVIEESTGE
jgi:outer membrane lipoprotein carrier protein